MEFTELTENWSLDSNSNFLIPIFLQPDAVDLLYFDVWLKLGQIPTAGNIQGWLANIEKFENWNQRWLISFLFTLNKYISKAFNIWEIHVFSECTVQYYSAQCSNTVHSTVLQCTVLPVLSVVTICPNDSAFSLVSCSTLPL